jgi:hypothetical protein
MDVGERSMNETVANTELHEFVASQVIMRCTWAEARAVDLGAGPGLVGGAAFFWGAPWRQGAARRIFRTLLRAVPGVAPTLVLFLTYPEALLGRLAVYSGSLDPRSLASRLLIRTRDYPRVMSCAS